MMDLSLMSHVVSLGVWNWFIVAAIFFILELAAPGAFMLWLGLAATLVGVLSLAVTWAWAGAACRVRGACHCPGAGMAALRGQGGGR